MFTLLDCETVIALNKRVLLPEELCGLASDKSLPACLGRVDNRLAYGFINDVIDLGVAYAEAISQGHCFLDGNKRTAFACMDVVFVLHGVAITWPTTETGDQIIALAQRKLEAADFGRWIRSLF